MKYRIFSILALIASHVTHASNLSNPSSQINYLNVDDDIVYFSTTEAKSQIPSCATDATKEQYAFSLLTETGRAMYSLLITAMAIKQAVTIESNDRKWR